MKLPIFLIPLFLTLAVYSQSKSNHLPVSSPNIFLQKQLIISHLDNESTSVDLTKSPLLSDHTPMDSVLWINFLWKTWWFKSIILLLAIALVFLAYGFRVKQIQKKEKMRSDYEIQINELENSSLRSQMNPHFIFNSLNTINSFINRNEGAKANQYITRFSKLMRLILDHSRRRKITLADELNVVDLYIQVERTRFDNKFDYRINIAPDIDPASIEISPLILQPFVENAIIHGLLPLQKGGLLQINIQRKDKILLCTIEDNGVGREKAMHYKQLSPEKRKSHGLEVTLKRIELFNKSHNIYVPVIVTDLIDRYNAAIGTKVEIGLAWDESF